MECVSDYCEFCNTYMSNEKRVEIILPNLEKTYPVCIECWQKMVQGKYATLPYLLISIWQKAPYVTYCLFCKKKQRGVIVKHEGETQCITEACPCLRKEKPKTCPEKKPEPINKSQLDIYEPKGKVSAQPKTTTT